MSTHGGREKNHVSSLALQPAVAGAADAGNKTVSRLQQQGPSPSGLFVQSPLLAKVMTILCEVTTACGILHGEHLARHNVLQCVMRTWEIALECTCAWSVADSEGDKKVYRSKAAATGTDTSWVSLHRDPTTTEVGPTSPSSGPQPITTTATHPLQDEDDAEQQEERLLMSRESAELESTIQGMLLTITHQPSPSSLKSVGRIDEVTATSLLEDDGTTFDDHRDARPSSTAPSIATATATPDSKAQRQLVVLAKTPVEHLRVLVHALEALRQTVVQQLLAHYCHISVVGSTDASLGPVVDWLDEQQRHHPSVARVHLPFSSRSNSGGMPFRHWMDLSVAGDPTVAAFRLMSRCIDIEAMMQEAATTQAAGGEEGGLFNGDGNECEAGSEPTVPSSSSQRSQCDGARRHATDINNSSSNDTNPAQLVVYASLTVAPRPVAPCHHIEPCFGNQQFLFAAKRCSHQDYHRQHLNEGLAGSSTANADDSHWWREEEDEAEEEDPSVGMLTALSHSCSRRDAYDGGRGWDRGGGMPLAITAGTLLEHQLPEDDRNAKPWKWEVPSSSPLATGSQLAIAPINDAVVDGNEEKDFMYREHFPEMRAEKADHHVDGTSPEIRVEADDARHSLNVGRAQRSQQHGGPRAGDAMFLLELRSRLEFWVRRGSKPRDYDFDFQMLAQQEQLNCADLGDDEERSGVAGGGADAVSPSTLPGHAEPFQGATVNAINNERSSTTHVEGCGVQHLVWDVLELPLKCFSSTIGTVRAVISVSSSSAFDGTTEQGQEASIDPLGGGGDEAARRSNPPTGHGGGVLGKTHELRQKLHSVSQCMRGCTFSIVDADSPSSTTPSAAGCASSSAAVDARGVNVSLVIHMSSTLPPSAVSSGSDDDDANDDARCNVELRKLQHRLITQHRWRGILWSERVGTAKATLVCHRIDLGALEADDALHCSCVRAAVASDLTAGTTTTTPHRDGDDGKQQHNLTAAIVYRVRLKPYVAPLWWFLQRHYLLLVDLDRTIVDNAIKPTAKRLRRCHRRHEGVQTTFVSWLVPSTATSSCTSTSFAAAASGGAATLRAKTEQIYLRPQATAYLQAMVQEWNCTAVLATKSSYARAEAILKSLADTEGNVFGMAARCIHCSKGNSGGDPCTSERVAPPSSADDGCGGGCDAAAAAPPPPDGCCCPRCGLPYVAQSYRIFAAEDLIPMQSVRSPLTPSGAGGRWGDALLRARKSTDVIVSSGKCGDNVTQHLLSLRYAILDDTPLVWEECDWSHVVPVDPFTLTHVDGGRYWDCDGGIVAYRVLQRLLFGTRRKRKRRDGGAASTGRDDDDASTPEDDEDAWWHAMMPPAATAGSDGAPAPAVVEEEEDDDENVPVSFLSGGSAHDAQPWWDSTTTATDVSPSSVGANGLAWTAKPSSWADNPDVEDVIPL